jgi:hypothetical protein
LGDAGLLVLVGVGDQPFKTNSNIKQQLFLQQSLIMLFLAEIYKNRPNFCQNTPIFAQFTHEN